MHLFHFTRDIDEIGNYMNVAATLFSLINVALHPLKIARNYHLVYALIRQSKRLEEAHSGLSDLKVQAVASHLFQSLKLPLESFDTVVRVLGVLHSVVIVLSSQLESKFDNGIVSSAEKVYSYDLNTLYRYISTGSRVFARNSHH